MIERLDLDEMKLISSVGKKLADKINELADQVNAISPVTTFTSGYITEATPKTEPTESKTSSVEKVLKYCRQKGVMCENTSTLGFCRLTACNKEQYNMQTIYESEVAGGNHFSESAEKMYTIEEVAEMMGKTHVYPCYALNDRCQLSGHDCKPTIAECWKYAIEQGWLKGENG